MAPHLFEKDVVNSERQETLDGDDLERTETVYDDNFHGLHLTVVLVFLVCSTRQL